MFRFSSTIRDVSFKSQHFVTFNSEKKLIKTLSKPSCLRDCRNVATCHINRNLFGSSFSRSYSKLNQSQKRSTLQESSLQTVFMKQFEDGKLLYSTDASTSTPSRRKAKSRLLLLTIGLSTLATVFTLMILYPNVFYNEDTMEASNAEDIYKKIMKENGLEVRGDRFEDVYTSDKNLEVVENHPSYELVENIINTIAETEGGNVDNNGFIAKTFHEFKLFFRALYLFWKFLPVLLYYPYASYRDSDEVWIRYYELILRTLRSSGALFIKLGQWASTRPDLIDIKMAKVLQSLHYEGQIHSIDETRKAIKDAFGKDIDEVFESFDLDVKGSGAIAQVYKAKLRSEYVPTYTEEQRATIPEKNLILSADVAVKVKHPTVDKDVSLDLELLQRFCRNISRIEHYRYMSIEENMLTFARSMRDQLDMRVEAHNLLIFNENFKAIPNITFPNPVMELCKHPSILVESWEEGTDVNKFVELPHEEHKNLRVNMANLGIVTYLKMLIMDNFLHGDLHPGNQKVQIDPVTGNARLVILDAGLVFSLKKKDRKKLIDIFMAISDKNGQKLAYVMCSSDDRYAKFFERQTGNSLDVERLNQYEAEMNAFIQEIFQLENKKVRVGEAFTTCLDVGRRHQIPMESVFSGIIIATAIIEGLGRRLNPDMDFVSECRPALKFCLHSDLMKLFFEQRYGSIKSNVASSLLSKLVPTYFG